MNSPRPSIIHQLNVTLTITTMSLLVTGLYAYLRYVHFGPIPESRIPLYVSNKAISWSSVVLLSITFALGPASTLIHRCRLWLIYRKLLGLTGAWLATLHILASLPIFNMFYYTAFFNFDGTLKVNTELSMLAGAIAWCLLLVPAIMSIPDAAAAVTPKEWQRFQRLGLLALYVTFGHVAWLGWQGWFEPQTWHGDLPPITLLSCGLVALVALLRVIGKAARKRTDE